MIDADELADRIHARIQELNVERNNLPDNMFKDRRERTINATCSGLTMALGIIADMLLGEDDDDA